MVTVTWYWSFYTAQKHKYVVYAPIFMSWTQRCTFSIYSLGHFSVILFMTCPLWRSSLLIICWISHQCALSWPQLKLTLKCSIVSHSTMPQGLWDCRNVHYSLCIESLFLFNKPAPKGVSENLAVYPAHTYRPHVTPQARTITSSRLTPKIV